MHEKINKTSICSIVFLDIIDYSKKSVSEQIEIKNQFNHLINHSLKDVDQDDRIILDTGDGAAIAHMGSPEDALFVSLSIRDEILKSNILSSMPLYVRFGINLGPVRVVSDINGQPNIIGDGINVAQRIMSFAKPNQILVSRSYYEVTSRLTQEISQMFDYSGIKHDKHVREHEVYAVRLLKDAVATEVNSIQLADMIKPVKRILNPSNWINWKYLALALPALMTLVIVIKTAATPREPMITLEQTVVEKPIALTVTKVLDTTTQNKQQLLPNETVETDVVMNYTNSNHVSTQGKKPTQAKPADKAIVQASVEEKSTKKKTSNKANPKILDDLPPEFISTKPASVQQPKVATKSAELTPKTVSPKVEESNHQSSWKNFTDGMKNGQKGACSQAEISMNVCH